MATCQTIVTLQQGFDTKNWTNRKHESKVIWSIYNWSKLPFYVFTRGRTLGNVQQFYLSSFARNKCTNEVDVQSYQRKIKCFFLWGQNWWKVHTTKGISVMCKGRTSCMWTAKLWTISQLTHVPIFMVVSYEPKKYAELKQILPVGDDNKSTRTVLNQKKESPVFLEARIVVHGRIGMVLTLPHVHSLVVPPHPSVWAVRAAWTYKDRMVHTTIRWHAALRAGKGFETSVCASLKCHGDSRVFKTQFVKHKWSLIKSHTGMWISLLLSWHWPVWSRCFCSAILPFTQKCQKIMWGWSSVLKNRKRKHNGVHPDTQQKPVSGVSTLKWFIIGVFVFGNKGI